MWWGMGRGNYEQAPMKIPTRCARCLNVNDQQQTILCAWCAMEDSRQSHRLDGHDATVPGIADCPACESSTGTPKVPWPPMK